MMSDKGMNIRKLEQSIRKAAMQRLLMVLLIAVFVGFLIAMGLLYVLLYPQQTKYYSTSMNGQTQELTPLSMPNQSDKTIIAWASQAAIAAYNYNFFDAEASIEGIRKYFTDDGWSQFISAIQESNILKEVRAKRIIVSAVATSTPVILQKGVLNGRFSWRVQVPILITYAASGSAPSAPIYPVTMLINRISTLESPQGIGISQFTVGSNLLERGT